MKFTNIPKEWPTSYSYDEFIGLLTYRITSTPSTSIPGLQELSIHVFHYSTPHLIIGCLSAQLVKAASLFSLQYTRPATQTHIHRCLRVLFTHKGCVREEILTHPRFKGSGVWGSEIEERDLGFVDGVWTDVGYRRRGIGGQMVELLKEVVGWHGVKYIITLPAYLPTASTWRQYVTDEKWRPWDEDEKHEVYGGSRIPSFCRFNLKFESYFNDETYRSRIFWRSCGARRIGLKNWFGIAIEKFHPANHLLAGKDTEDMHTLDRWRRMPYVCLKNEPHDIRVCEEEAGKPTMSSEITDALSRLEDQEVVDFLYDKLRALRWTDMHQEIRRSYAYHPIVHIAVEHGYTRTIRWLSRHFSELVEKETNFDGYTASEYLELVIERNEECEAYGEKWFGCNELERRWMTNIFLENRENLQAVLAEKAYRLTQLGWEQRR